jgi:hypothetical protein
VKNEEGSQRPDTAIEGVKILLVEDDTDTLRLLETILRSAHAEVSSARSMQDAPTPSGTIAWTSWSATSP